MLAKRRFKSSISVAKQRMAMISEATVISKPSSRGIPFKGPPRPTET
jgi:hypothetical protein